jgi:hypothetical protein
VEKRGGGEGLSFRFSLFRPRVPAPELTCLPAYLPSRFPTFLLPCLRASPLPRFPAYLPNRYSRPASRMRFSTSRTGSPITLKKSPSIRSTSAAP